MGFNKMRVNLSDAVDDLAPVEPPPCFHNRAGWVLYLKSAAAAQGQRNTQKVIITGDDGQPRFNDRLNYCADCTQIKSMEMLALGRCDPYHLSDQPDPPDTHDAPGPRLGDGGAARIKDDATEPAVLCLAVPLAGDAFERLAGSLVQMAQRPAAWDRV